MTNPESTISDSTFSIFYFVELQKVNLQKVNLEIWIRARPQGFFHLWKIAVSITGCSTRLFVLELISRFFKYLAHTQLYVRKMLMLCY